MRTVLLTGFEPFNGESLNPAWQAVQALSGWSDGTFTVCVRQLPCVFGVALEVLQDAMSTLQPILVIAVGQAGGRAELSLERVAINLDDAPLADNRQARPIDQPIAVDGPAAYFSTLPIKAIVQALRLAGLPAAVSQSAGTFVCNHVFYGLMHALATRPAPRRECAGRPLGTFPATGLPVVKAGFMHVPYLPVQAAAHPGAASMALADIVAGLRIAIEVALAIEQDLHTVEGRLD